MNIALIGDMHWGARNNSELFLKHLSTICRDHILPMLQKHKVKHVIQLGDFMDKRRTVDFRVLATATTEFIDPLRKLGIQLHVFPGNHDVYHRHTNILNSLQSLFGWMEHVHVYERPTTLKIDTCTFDIIPWINNQNYDDTIQFIEQSTSQYCVGHFELDGFDMYAGVPASGGMNREVLKNYDHVWSGHYHTRSVKDNVTYVGTPYEITWSDYNDVKGIEIFNTRSKKSKVIKTPYRMFHKIFYESEQDYKDFDFSQLKDTIVKIIIKDRDDPKKLERFLDDIAHAKPHDYTAVESDHIVAYGVEQEDVEGLDTFSVLIQAAQQAAKRENLCAEKIDKLIKNVYAEAVALGRDI